MLTGLFSQPKVNLRDLGLSELRFSHVHDVLERLLPSIDPEEKSISSAAQHSTAWRTTHISAPSFFQNKYGEVTHNMRGCRVFKYISLCEMLVAQ